ncbi:hypothetical protein LXT13_20800 [Pelomonas sp. P8]|uniref:Uncharacterized protein n=1 Tax=Pelomonas cellulosilytica TaxID=2906762 RepID=A0ABS8Y195_9BURK|nr:hypothetical protein [Pelomonas sp. P8]MCE4556842.1 hypothetical protein [Pelomonas sp. P8]
MSNSTPALPHQFAGPAISPALFRVVQRTVRTLEDRVNGVVWPRQSQTRGERVANPFVRLERVLNPLDGRLSIGQSSTREQQEELFLAQASHRLSRAQVALGVQAEMPQHGIAARMAMGVVDLPGPARQS